MKKLKLKLEGKEMLNRDEMRKLSKKEMKTIGGGCLAYLGCDYGDDHSLSVIYNDFNCNDSNEMDETCEFIYGRGAYSVFCHCV